MGKPAFCICENKDADQLRGTCEADQRLYFRYLDGTIPLLPIVCACPYSSNIGLSAMTLYYPVRDKTTTRPVNTQNYYTKIF